MVFDSNAERCLTSALPQCYAQKREREKRQYNDRVLQILFIYLFIYLFTLFSVG